MDEREFRASLPKATECEVCSRPLLSIDWTVLPTVQGHWMGLGIVKCEVCSVVRVAAAGSDEFSHAHATSIRLKFMKVNGYVQ
jgi:hypothetical protein